MCPLERRADATPGPLLLSMAVDAESGMVLAPEMADSRTAPGDTVAKVFFKAVQASRHSPGRSECAARVSKIALPHSWNLSAWRFGLPGNFRPPTKLDPTCSGSFMESLVLSHAI